MERHYDVLGVSPEADQAELRRAYRTLSKEHHPDQGGSREQFLRIKRAYEAITGESAPDGDESAVGAPAYDPTFDPSRRDDTHGFSLEVEGDLLSVTLLSLVQRLELSRIVPDRVESAVSRPVAFFLAENVSDERLEWRGRSNTSFIGDDGFMYEGSNIVRPHARHLPGSWCGADVDVAPDRALEAVVVAGEVPQGVTIEKVVYTQHDADGGTERYLFDLRPRVRDGLDSLPDALE